MMRTLLTAAALSLLAATPGAAQESRTVSYAGLDLSHAAGRAEFDARIWTAVRDVCGRPLSSELRAVQEMKSCRQATLEYANRDRDEAVSLQRRGRAIIVAAR